MTNVHRDYDQAELDRQYNVRAGIPETEAILERWLARTAALQKRRAAPLDLAYGAEPLQTLDLYSSGRAGAPLVVFIHGGYWQTLDKAHFGFVAEAYLADGLDVAVIDYRLAPNVGIEAMIDDCRSCIGWLWRHAGQLGYDGSRIVITGHSAGGHLTAVMVSTDWTQHGLPADAIRGGCALSGLYDLEPIRLCYLNAVVGLDAPTAERASPIHMVPAVAPPLVLSTGGDESDEFHRQQSEYAARWRERGLACRTIPQADGHHFDMVDRLGTKGSSLYEAVLAMAMRS